MRARCVPPSSVFSLPLISLQADTGHWPCGRIRYTYTEILTLLCRLPRNQRQRSKFQLTRRVNVCLSPQLFGPWRWHQVRRKRKKISACRRACRTGSTQPPCARVCFFGIAIMAFRVVLTCAAPAKLHSALRATRRRRANDSPRSSCIMPHPAVTY